MTQHDLASLMTNAIIAVVSFGFDTFEQMQKIVVRVRDVGSRVGMKARWSSVKRLNSEFRPCAGRKPIMPIDGTSDSPDLPPYGSVARCV